MRISTSKNDDAAPKMNSKVESTLNKLKRSIESETNHLGLNKKDEAKKTGDIKSRLEVLFDHM